MPRALALAAQGRTTAGAAAAPAAATRPAAAAAATVASAKAALMRRAPRALVLVHGALLAGLSKKHGEHPLAPNERLIYIAIAVGLTLGAGLMSGLTLGLMSMDMVDLEVLRRSGTPSEQRHAAGIIPLVRRQHFLLVTLLLCNAVAMEALPLFLDRLADPVTAIVISVTAVLVFGEILPQALCSKYGLAVGYHAAWLVRLLMALTSPISWPIAKLLDVTLGAEHKAMFRRTQLKALVDLHGADGGMGGNLTAAEVAVIRGALDLTSKTARRYALLLCFFVACVCIFLFDMHVVRKAGSLLCVSQKPNLHAKTPNTKQKQRHDAAVQGVHAQQRRAPRPRYDARRFRQRPQPRAGAPRRRPVRGGF
jgi:hypothetical protein